MLDVCTAMYTAMYTAIYLSIYAAGTFLCEEREFGRVGWMDGWMVEGWGGVGVRVGGGVGGLDGGMDEWMDGWLSGGVGVRVRVDAVE